MALTKGTDVVALKKIFKEQNPELLQSFLHKLDPETLEVFEKTIATSWTPIEIQTKIYELAAQTLYPNHQLCVFQLHRELAQRSYSGIYKLFLRIPTIPFLVGRAAAVWRSYYDTGQASVENIQKNSLEYIVRAFPNLPHTLREAANAHMTVLVEATGAQNVRVTRQDDNPNAWTWIITWQ